MRLNIKTLLEPHASLWYFATIIDSADSTFALQATVKLYAAFAPPRHYKNGFAITGLRYSTHSTLNLDKAKLRTADTMVVECI